MNAMLTEIKEWKDHWMLLTFGMFAAFVDGVVIAQAWDWTVSAHRMSIWILY